MVKRKTSDGISAPVPNAPELPVDIQNDEYRGHGGSYIVDPATGNRVRVEGPGVEQNVIPAVEAETETEKADEIE